jgi:MFS family permease
MRLMAAGVRSRGQIARLWRRPGYAGFYGTVLLSRTSAFMFNVTVVLLVIEPTGSVALAGVTAAAAALPAAATGPLFGAWLDVARSRRLLIVSDQLASAVAMAALLALAGHAPDWTLPAVAVLYSVTRPFSAGSFVSALPEIAGAEMIAMASSLEASSLNFATVFGPALAGLLAGTVGPGPTMTVQVVITLVVAALIAVNPTFEIRPLQRAQGISTALSTGLGALAREPVLRASVVASALAMFGWGLLAVGFPLYAQRTLHVGANSSGYLWAAVGLGSIIGTFVLRGERTLNQMALSYALLGVSALAWPVAGSLVVGVGLVGLTGVLEGPAFSGSVAIRQRLPPPAVRAQVISTIASVTLTASSLGAALGGGIRHPLTIVLAFAVVNGLAAICLASAGRLGTGRPRARTAPPSAT